MLKKAYVRVLNVLFWVQQAAALCAVVIFFITMLSPGKTAPLLEDVLLRVVCIVLVSAPLFWIAALLRLFRGPGLSAEKHAASAGAPPVILILVWVWYLATYC